MKFSAEKNYRANASEFQECASLIEWAHVTAIPFARRLIHIPNEGRRSVVTGARLKKIGMTAGVFDYFFGVPCAPFSGLWLEMKRKGGKLSAAQEQFQRDWSPAFLCRTCDSWESAACLILDWLFRAEAIDLKSFRARQAQIGRRIEQG